MEIAIFATNTSSRLTQRGIYCFVRNINDFACSKTTVMYGNWCCFIAPPQKKKTKLLVIFTILRNKNVEGGADF